MRAGVTLAGLALALGLLTGCGEDEDEPTSADDPDPTPGTSQADPNRPPDCVDVWKSGGTVPDDYEGCVTPPGYDGPTMVALYGPPGGGCDLWMYDDKQGSVYYAERVDGAPVVKTEAGDFSRETLTLACNGGS